MRRWLGLAVAFTFLISACEEPVPVPTAVSSEPSLPAPTPTRGTAVRSVTPVSDRPVPAPAPDTSNAASQPPSPTVTETEGVACPEPAMDLASTALGAWLASGVIPTDRPGEVFAFEVADNQFSPCEELSWVVLSDPAGVPARDTTVFFAGAELVTEPAPALLPPVAAVEKRADGSVAVSRQDGGEATYRLAAERLLVTGEPPDAPHLDLGRAGPPPPATPRPHGNAYTRPWDHERPRGARYSMEVGETRIICDFALFNDLQLVCYSPTDSPWPTVTENVPAETRTRANVAILNFQSLWAVSTLSDPFIAADSEAQPLPEDSVTRIDDVFVDTRGNVAKIYDSRWAYVIGEGVAMPAKSPAPPIDTSRWPEDLRPWEPAPNGAPAAN
ncbi:hypothetical protein [Corynebacterium guangdongense]|uniref:LppP/LprE lipoprotein n=1 Tax=Corynebacterium guangdongense TaxID=1783348 RepID=A0ABU1ZWF8_9CORY|nr:hypothetical protein [Corynebacterium guangdongense]MDR7329235.1 hypothetical protein [Corynebacterium guangdongense]WJZ17801.1 hypothetical protein CGUA_06135 [Corynebacterium guangdongense]